MGHGAQSMVRPSARSRFALGKSTEMYRKCPHQSWAVVWGQIPMALSYDILGRLPAALPQCCTLRKSMPVHASVTRHARIPQRRRSIIEVYVAGAEPVSHQAAVRAVLTRHLLCFVDAASSMPPELPDTLLGVPDHTTTISVERCKGASYVNPEHQALLPRSVRHIGPLSSGHDPLDVLGAFRVYFAKVLE